MNDICRLCLSISNETMHKLFQESEILCKISSCFSVKITLNNGFPTHICDTCLNKINETYEFHKKVTENQQKLVHYLQNEGYSLEVFYEIIKNANLIKEEKRDPYEELNGKDNTYNNESNYAISINEANYSSDDEITLSMLKKEQETTVNTNPKLKKPKVILDDIKSKDIPVVQYEFNCLTCFTVFKSKNNLMKHYSVEHSIKKNSDEYIAQVSNGKTTYECKKCDRVYEKKKLIQRHMITHQCDRPFVCNFCGRTYKSVCEIVRHGRVHNGFKLICPQNCGYNTVYKGALKEHIKRHSEKPEYKYSCDKCGKRFNVKTWHDQHQNVHSGLKPFVCDICGLAFHMDRYLKTHRSAVHPQSSSVKRYVCLHCQLPCDSRKTLTLHMEVHGIKTSFLCDTCGKVLSSAELLKHHKRVHLGIKPYSCSVCSKSFTKKFNLKIHERTHTGERSHVCNKCGKCYTQSSTLLRHYRRCHAVSHKCSKCDKVFSSRNQMDTHQKLCL